MSKARLIAAAPEMLEALQEYVADTDAILEGLDIEDMSEAQRHLAECQALAEGAIAKATGGKE